MRNSFWIYLAAMTLVSCALRILPITLIRRPIKSRFIQSLFYYMPYVTLAVMTVPAIFTITENPICGIGALIATIIIAWITSNLMLSAATACVAVFLLNMIL